MRALRGLHNDRDQLGSLAFIAALVALIVAGFVWFLEVTVLGARADIITGQLTAGAPLVLRLLPLIAVLLIIAVSVYGVVRVIQLPGVEEYDPIYIATAGLGIAVAATVCLVFAAIAAFS